MCDAFHERLDNQSPRSKFDEAYLAVEKSSARAFSLGRNDKRSLRDAPLRTAMAWLASRHGVADYASARKSATPAFIS